ncbi:CBS domain-containing protein [Amycolatopsis keratiniphila]|uniref:CBS domain-containing membrane protein n=1 Tax=Amycolatopsis keratiniphila TaxID=129921 RepID=R4SUX7_9PSEU|nr:CBS domain-containing protein [Amycolatopsis keratiniphila]AGM07184.1 CBS domain-containing membrane protein [Amycolatopsis keratiniphila]
MNDVENARVAKEARDSIAAGSGSSRSSGELAEAAMRRYFAAESYRARKHEERSEEDEERPMTGMAVRDVMTREVHSVRKSTPIAEIAGILVGRGISAVPVVNDDRYVIGVVSEADLLLKHVESVTASRPRVPGIRSKSDGRAAEDVMSAPAVVVEAGRPVVEAARLMVGHRVKRLPVVDRYGKLTGIVSRADLVHAFVRTDAEIRDEVLRDISELTRRPSQGEVRAEVENGTVTLRGEVERRSQAVLLAALVRRIAGVVKVVDHVRFGWDDEANR